VEQKVERFQKLLKALFFCPAPKMKTPSNRGLSYHPEAHPFADLAFLDCVIISHQLGQGGHEISEPRHALRALFLPQADRLQHEAFWPQPECSEVIRTILGEHLGGMNYFRSQHDGFCVDGMHCGP